MARRCSSDVLDEELALGERVVLENAHWVVLVPFWARWPFETLLLPRRPIACLTELPDDERDALAEILGHWTSAMDNLFRCDFPYSIGWHGAPRSPMRCARAWVLHAALLSAAAALRRRCASSWSASRCSRKRSAT